MNVGAAQNSLPPGNIGRRQAASTGAVNRHIHPHPLVPQARQGAQQIAGRRLGVGAALGHTKLPVAGVSLKARQLSLIQIGKAVAPGARVVVRMTLQHPAGGQAVQ